MTVASFLLLRERLERFGSNPWWLDLGIIVFGVSVVFLVSWLAGR